MLQRELRTVGVVEDDSVVGVVEEAAHAQLLAEADHQANDGRVVPLVDDGDVGLLEALA